MITALPDVAQNIGINRIVIGNAIVSPVGMQGVDSAQEMTFRKRLLDEALQALTA